MQIYLANSQSNISPVELKPDKFTGQLPKGPVVMTAIVVDEQGKWHHIQKVGDGQVDHIDVVFGQIGPSPPYLQYDSTIERKAEQEDKGVHSRE